MRNIALLGTVIAFLIATVFVSTELCAQETEPVPTDAAPQDTVTTEPGTVDGGETERTDEPLDALDEGDIVEPPPEDLGDAPAEDDEKPLLGPAEAPQTLVQEQTEADAADAFDQPSDEPAAETEGQELIPTDLNEEAAETPDLAQPAAEPITGEEPAEAVAEPEPSEPGAAGAERQLDGEEIIAEEPQPEPDAAEPDLADEEEQPAPPIDSTVEETTPQTPADSPPAGLVSGSLDQALANLIGLLVDNLPPSEMQWVVAVADFRDLRGGFNDLGRYVSERMTTRFSLVKGMRVVERRRLMQALKTLRLGIPALVEPRLARRLGAELGANLLVTGTISDLNDRIELDARPLDIAAGQLLPGAFTSFPKDDVVVILMARGRLDSEGQDPRGEESEEEILGVPQPTYENESYSMAIEAARKTERAISIILSYENRSNEPISLLFRRTAYLIDDRGDRWDQDHRDTAHIWVHCCGTGIELIPGTKRRTRLDFVTQDSGEGRTFTLIAKEIRPLAERTVIIDGIQLGKALP
ncbi:MAG: hypothetical protein IID61_06905 [SAR324 cluster bacterium]|nr:hypothetical protein [SAR324 cluster bacterium]